MGCDIHLFVERKSTNPKTNGKWRWVSPKENWKDSDEDWYMSRNYDLFAILADVRNDRGVTNTDGFCKFNPISSPKGWPSDASSEANQIHMRWDGDAHSDSYLTLRELVEFDWNQTITLTGFVDAIEYADMLYKSTNVPRIFWGGSNGKPQVNTERMKLFLHTDHFLCHLRRELANWMHVVANPKGHNENWQEHVQRQIDYHRALLTHYEPLVDRTLNGIFTDQMLSTALKWEQTYADSAKRFHSSLIPKLKELGGLDNVRIVFFFDN